MEKERAIGGYNWKTGEKGKLNFWCWVYCNVFRSRSVMIYTWNLHDVVNQCCHNKNT